MSLSSLLKKPEVRLEFSRRIKKPPPLEKRSILCPPLTKNYSIVGGAYDYLFRFKMLHVNPMCRKPYVEWVAHSAVSLLQRTFGEDDSLSRRADDLLNWCLKNYWRYLKKDELSDDYSSALWLSKLDSIFRGFRPELHDTYMEALRNYDEKDVVDLKALISATNFDEFRAKNFCALNPTFGEASNMVGGADADLVIDSTLVELKTTVELSIERAFLYQLVGYYILMQIDNRNKEDWRVRERGIQQWAIDRFAIYFSRYGWLVNINIEDIITNEDLASLSEWFQKYLGELSRPMEELQVLPEGVETMLACKCPLCDMTFFANKLPEVGDRLRDVQRRVALHAARKHHSRIPRELLKVEEVSIAF